MVFLGRLVREVYLGVGCMVGAESWVCGFKGVYGIYGVWGGLGLVQLKS